MVRKVPRLRPRPERNKLAARGGRDRGKICRRRERDARAMRGTVAAAVPGVPGRSIAILIEAGVHRVHFTAGITVLGFGLLLV